MQPQPMEDSMLEQVDAQRRLWPCGKLAVDQAPGMTSGPMEKEVPMLEWVCWQDLRPCGTLTLEQFASE